MIEMMTNLEELAEAIYGYIEGSKGIEQADYMDGVLRVAHAEALEDFHALVAGHGKAMGHMYEYGTVPIHDAAPGGIMLSPTDQSARLWVDILAGGGGVKDISFMYRDAVMPNPKKTPENTGGVSDKILQHLQINKGKQYVFRQRAEITDQLESVTVEPTGEGDNTHVFVPVNIEGDQMGKKGGWGVQWAESSTWTPGDPEPGADVQPASFVGVFAAYWRGAGAATMMRSVEIQVDRDVKILDEIIQSNVDPHLKSVKAISMRGAALRGGKARKQWTLRIKELQRQQYTEREIGDIIA